ncbi:MAG: pseudouridine-5'-phosphate glycosidase [Pseudomonadota bacterium]
MTLPMDILPEVADTLASGGPVVALESTIISHGMPYPQNVETARAVEATVREHGAVPATIAVIDGRLKIGLANEALEHLASAEDVEKLSRQNMAACLARGGTGATTVAATMISAHLAGISVFATGGIGGVHRGAEQSFDISADLQELAQTPVAVVCAGAKAILDIPKTLEVLETLGVPVIAFGQDTLPAFWSQSSGYPATRVDTTAALAESFAMARRLGLKAGMLVANPIPKADEIPPDVINPIIEQALNDATESGISHGGVTPFVLDRVFHLTEGRSLDANTALVLNNARLAGGLASDLSAQTLS